MHSGTLVVCGRTPYKKPLLCMENQLSIHTQLLSTLFAVTLALPCPLISIVYNMFTIGG